NAFVRTLQRTPTQLTWKRLVLDQEVPLGDEGLTIEAHAQPGKLPVHLVGVTDPSPEDNVAVVIKDAQGKRIIYAGATSSAAPAPWMRGADALFFDGTFWSSDELVAAGLSKARAEDMAHAPIGGDAGSLARLASLDVRRR